MPLLSNIVTLAMLSAVILRLALVTLPPTHLSMISLLFPSQIPLHILVCVPLQTHSVQQDLGLLVGQREGGMHAWEAVLSAQSAERHRIPSSAPGTQ